MSHDNILSRVSQETLDIWTTLWLLKIVRIMKLDSKHFYFFWFILFIFSHTIWLQPQPCLNSLDNIPTDQDPLFLCFPSERAGLLEMSTNIMIRYNKTRHKPSCPCMITQPSRRKIVPRASKRVRNTLTVSSPRKTPSKATSIERIELRHCKLHNCSLRLSKPLWSLLSWFCKVWSFPCPWHIWLLKNPHPNFCLLPHALASG